MLSASDLNRKLTDAFIAEINKPSDENLDKAQLKSERAIVPTDLKAMLNEYNKNREDFGLASLAPQAQTSVDPTHQ